MEDILASIRRILNEDDATAKPTDDAHPKTKQGEESEVFALDTSMMVAETSAAPVVLEEIPPVSAAAALKDKPKPDIAREPEQLAETDRGVLEPLQPEPVMPVSQPIQAAPPVGLVAPEAVAAAAQSVGSLRRTLEAGRHSLLVRGGGPTLDEMVREELRPVLKAWLDANLPSIVERLVQAEIERLVGRADL